MMGETNNSEKTVDGEELKRTVSQADEQKAPPVNAAAYLTISKDKLKAYLYMEPPLNGGETIALSALEERLAGLRITVGIDCGKLKEITENPVYHQDILIAAGRAPVNGVDGTYEFLFRANKDLRPTLREDGTADYRDLGLVENVKAGQALCRITLPTDGEEGVTVAGEKLLQIKGKAVPDFCGKNTELTEKGTVIAATIDGQLEFNGRKININETFTVQEDVDISTGNIKVTGNVVVKGMIRPGFIVEATGNIDVRGMVEAAQLKAAGNIALHGGMTGSNLNCDGNLNARFIENSTIFVKGEVQAEYIMNSNIRCGKSLQVTGIIAKFLGGSCVVGQDVIARTIGSSAGIKTELELGTDPSFLDRQQELEKQLPKCEKLMNSLQQLISILKQLEEADRLTPEKKQLLDEAIANYDTNKAMLDGGRQELIDINEKIKAKGYGKVVCTGTIYPGTMLTIGMAKLLIEEPLSHVSFRYEKGEICQSSAI